MATLNQMRKQTKADNKKADEYHKQRVELRKISWQLERDAIQAQLDDVISREPLWTIEETVDDPDPGPWNPAGDRNAVSPQELQRRVDHLFKEMKEHAKAMKERKQTKHQLQEEADSLIERMRDLKKKVIIERAMAYAGYKDMMEMVKDHEEMLQWSEENEVTDFDEFADNIRPPELIEKLGNPDANAHYQMYITLTQVLQDCEEAIRICSQQRKERIYEHYRTGHKNKKTGK